MEKIFFSGVLFLIIIGCTKEVDLLPKKLEKVSCFYSLEHNQIKRAFVPEEQVYSASRLKPKFLANIILLDFDGFQTTQSSWGSLNLTGSGLSQAEQQKIIDSISFDFKDFQVTITTNENYYNSFPIERKQRAVFTEDNTWYGTNYGGVAYTGSFGWKDGEEPCFVFTKLFKYDLKKISEAGSHEIGHTLGLTHQRLYDSAGNLVAEYNKGSNGVAPIMGVSYYARGEWWKSDQQDDVKIINKMFIK